MHLTAASQEAVLAAVGLITDETIKLRKGRCIIGTALELKFEDGRGNHDMVTVPANAALRFWPDIVGTYGKPAPEQKFPRDHFAISDFYAGIYLVYKSGTFYITERTTAMSMPGVNPTHAVPA